MHSRLSCWHHSRLLWRQEHPLPHWGHQARQSATLYSLPSTGPPGPRSDHCNDPPFCNVNPSLIRTILPNCSCDQVPPYLMTLPLILDHMTSSLRWYTRLFMACLNPPPPAQHCAASCTVCNSPSLSPSWAGLSIPHAPAHPQASLKSNLPAKLCLTAPGS